MSKARKEMAIVIGVVSAVFIGLVVVGCVAGWLSQSWEIVLFSCMIAVFVVIVYASIIIEYLRGEKQK